MIHFVSHNQIQKNRWDHAIQNAFNGSVYAYSWYLDIIHPEWDALIEDDYRRIMPLTSGRKFGFSYLYQPYFAQHLGLYSQAILNEEWVSRFLQKAAQHFDYIDIKLNPHNKVSGHKAKLTSHRNFELDLIPDYEKLQSAYHKNCKRNLKKSKGYQLRLSANIQPEWILNLFRKNRGKAITHWKDFHYKRLQRLLYLAVHKGRAKTYGVFNDKNELICGACFMNSHQRLIFIFSATSPEAKEKQAMTFLIDEIIKSFSGQHLLLDFEGSDDDQLARFYRGFGSHEIHYTGYCLNMLPWPVRYLKK